MLQICHYPPLSQQRANRSGVSRSAMPLARPPSFPAHHLPPASSCPYLSSLPLSSASAPPPGLRPHFAGPFFLGALCSFVGSWVSSLACLGSPAMADRPGSLTPTSFIAPAVSYLRLRATQVQQLEVTKGAGAATNQISICSSPTGLSSHQFYSQLATAAGDMQHTTKQ